LAYLRSWQTQRLLVLANLSGRPAIADLGQDRDLLQGHVLLAIGRFPSSDDAVEFEAPDWRLLASVRNILKTAERRLAELVTPDASVADESTL